MIIKNRKRKIFSDLSEGQQKDTFSSKEFPNHVFSREAVKLQVSALGLF